MEWWQALVLGLVEGLTEYLPVSSTGHLILAQRALGLANDEAAKAFAICIQAGAIAAVVALYRRRCASMFAGLAGGDPRGRRLVGLLLVAFAPAALCGIALEDRIDRHLFGLWPVIAAWLVGGLAILWVEARRRRSAPRDPLASGGADRVAEMAWGSALVIGLFQCLALWPGTSRSLVTIAGGVLAGLSLAAAVEFSLLLGLITLFAATAHKARGHGAVMLEQYGAFTIALGFACAALSAFVSVRWMVGYLQRRGLALFGWYRIVLALVVAACVLWGGLASG
jgi:undecaprenyl-diphosphatase